MSEKRGYPNPNYTEGDILESIPMEVKTELLLDDQLVEYIQKAAMFDCLAGTIKTMGKVDEEVVRALTGTLDPKENEELEQFRRWWHEERDENEKLKNTINRMGEEVDNLRRKLSEAEDLLNDMNRDNPNWPPKDEEVSGEEVAKDE